ncbi:MAG: lipid A biosynthesis acyltransferase [Bacteroidota bacterium]
MLRFLFYLLIKPLSYLPFSVLYRVSDALYILVYYVGRYRRTVVFTNLKNAFPQKSQADIAVIAKRFYRHFCDLMVEALKMFTISEKELRRRCQILNPELMETYARRGKNLIIPAGHYNNWEMAATASNQQIPHQSIGIYAPLKNELMNEEIRKSRERFGLALWPRKEVKKQFANTTNELIAVLFGADQSPNSSRTAYWTTFLNQETGVMIGSEKYAKQYDYPVVFGKVVKVKRGYYTFEFIPIEDHPRMTSYGEITEKYTRLLESIIIENPQYWLWSHRRWKRKKPVLKNGK